MNNGYYRLLSLVVSAAYILTYSAVIMADEKPHWGNLLDESLSAWEVWTGVPSAGLNLPKAYSRGDDPKRVPAIGLGDPFSLFSTLLDENGHLVLHVTGESRGALSTKAEYANYHLSLLFKWAEQDGTINQDSGLLYHAVGAHGAMWQNWKRSLEFQMKKDTIGDLYLLGGFEVTATMDDKYVWDPTKPPIKRGINTVSKIAAAQNKESPPSEWTRVDIYVVDDAAYHVVNGQLVVAISNIELNNKRVTSGTLQLQSGSSACYFKDIRIRKITTLPNINELAYQSVIKPLASIKAESFAE